MLCKRAYSIRLTNSPRCVRLFTRKAGDRSAEQSGTTYTKRPNPTSTATGSFQQSNHSQSVPEGNTVPGQLETIAKYGQSKSPPEIEQIRDAKRKKDEMSFALDPLTKFTKRLIDVSADRDSDVLHGDARDMLAKIPQKPSNARIVPSLEKAQFMEQEPQEMAAVDDDSILFMEAASTQFHPGTFAELRRNNIVTFGIILKVETLMSRLHAITLTNSGEIWPHLLTDITYLIPQFITQDLIKRAGSDYLAEDHHQTLARLEIVEKVRVFARQHEQQYNKTGKSFRDFYERVRHPDPNSWTDLTTEDATRLIDERRPPPVLTIFAIHSHLMSDPLHFVADQADYKTSQSFAIRPKAHVDTILMVDEWTRLHATPFTEFVTKAKSVRAEIGRVQQQHNGDPLPTKREAKLPQWSETDLVFINFLKNSLRTQRSYQRDPYERSLPSLVKQIGLLPGESVNATVVSRILRDIGMLTPWDDIITRDPNLRVDQLPPEISPEHQVIKELTDFNRNHPSQAVSQTLMKKLLDLHLPGKTQFHTMDAWADVRHDFKNLAVHVIDDETAQELDDGISIEPVTGEPGRYWVHVHVADPTTILPHGHVLDVRAQKLGVSIYSEHRTWPMLPHGLTELFSLGARGESEPQEVLTLSIKLSEDGELLDQHIRPSVIRNIKVVSYDQVDHALDIPLSSGRSFPFGSPDPKAYPAIPEGSLKELKKLRELTIAIRQRILRQRDNFYFSFPSSHISFTSSIPQEWLPTKSAVWTGYPSMLYSVQEAGSIIGAREMVANFMIMAGRAASRYCVERGLPAIRRSNKGPVCDESIFAELMGMRDEHGMIEATECLKRNVYLLGSEPTLEPKQHWQLGVPDGEGYIRITSPLRRYSDMLMHWQIKHDLLPASKKTNIEPMFPSELLMPLAWRLHAREALSRKTEQIYNRYWSAEYFDRYIKKEQEKHGKDYNPFPGLTATTVREPTLDTMNMEVQVISIIEKLGIRGHIKNIPKNAEMPIGTKLPVKITKISGGLTPSIDLSLA
ncbi:hypothetical protein M422DRAFT_202596 [Sphaerobolus stellatus SS14]|nr:hypothetical protein M422DRAFT_202596 [Sphaerobolus stellatus SS14]